MKHLGSVLMLLMGLTSFVQAKQESFRQQYVQPIDIKIYSIDKGLTREEYRRCTPQTCCFSERYYCFMDNGECYCDLHLCQEWPDTINPRRYYMKISGFEAERICGRERRLHEATGLCLCDPDKDPPCDACNPPIGGSMSCRAVPQDCKP